MMIMRISPLEGDGLLIPALLSRSWTRFSNLATKAFRLETSKSVMGAMVALQMKPGSNKGRGTREKGNEGDGASQEDQLRRSWDKESRRENVEKASTREVG